jgi:hypothetical protein
MKMFWGEVKEGETGRKKRDPWPEMRGEKLEWKLEELFF